MNPRVSAAEVEAVRPNSKGVDPRELADDRVSVELVVGVFNRLFANDYQTTLVAGADEPYYQVLSNGIARIHCREDFISSALHEVAHWCLAGAKRRRIDDYGYWYQGKRDEKAQRQFESVEVKPQALEWILSQVLQHPFKISVDNLDLPDHDASRFQESVRKQALEFVKEGIGSRAMLFAKALHNLNSVGDSQHSSAEIHLSNIVCTEQFLELPQ